MKKNNLPIGYWLKRADELLTIRIDEIQQSNGLSRLDWQILNVVFKTDSVNRQEIIQTLQPFAQSSVVNEKIDALAERNLIKDSESKDYTMTKVGADLYDQALLLQNKFRQRISKGVSKSEYKTTITVLKQLVDNLETIDGAL